MYEAAYVPFEECTGADLKFEGSNEFEAQLKVREKAGNPPDIALIPQPGLLANMVATGSVVKPTGAPSRRTWTPTGRPDWKAYGTVDGIFYAPPNSSNLKSLVWYSPTMFAENGWAIPTTWDELKTLTDTIAASPARSTSHGARASAPATPPVGRAPTGSRTSCCALTGPEVYDQWVKHEIPFNDPQIVTALDEVGCVPQEPQLRQRWLRGREVDRIHHVPGRRPYDPRRHLRDAPPGDSSTARSAPRGRTIAEDGDVFAFYLPAVDPATKPVLGGGEFITAYADQAPRSSRPRSGCRRLTTPTAWRRTARA